VLLHKVWNGPMVSWKLLFGKIVTSWREYPAQRRAFSRLKPGPPVLVTGAPRSGTTWVGQMLSVPGLWHVHEPFNPARGAWHETLTYLDPEGRHPCADAVMERILAGRLRRLAINCWSEHWLMPCRLFPQPIRRVLVKDPIACLMSAYLTRRFPLQTLVLFRHPAGFVCSMRRLGWPYSGIIERLLGCRPAMERWLSPYADLMASYRSVQSVEALTVLLGCLDTILWGFCRTYARMVPLCYEDLCVHPLDRFRALFDGLALPYGPEAIRLHHELCFREQAGRDDYGPHALRRNSRDMAFRWRRLMSPEDQRRVRRIWEQFDLPLYKGRQWDKPQVLPVPGTCGT